MDRDAIEARIRELQAQLEVIKIEERAIAQKELEAIKVEWEWRVEWLSEHRVRIERKHSDAYIKKMAELRQKYPFLSLKNHYDHWHGMIHYIIEGWMLLGDSGYVIIDPRGTKYSVEKEPFKLTAMEYNDLMVCYVPEDWRRAR